ncbi:MAG TPA: molybdate ABC transporter substrate-binding protein, partial [Burkholderiales bacterium]|nr:molybdate ABC transporter substrate-binding protein [Burkholderiales bacterium]
MKHCITASGARRWLRHAIVAVAALVFTAGLGTPAFASGDVVVFAAASLKNALDDISAQYQRETGRHTVISFAASSALARQIEAGAPADIYISANLSWMDYLQKHKLIKSGTRSTLLGNELVLVASKDSAINKIAIKPGFPLAQLLGKNG